MGQDCVSPSNHTAFSNNRELIELIEEIAKSTGLPVDIKAAVGQMDEWKELFSLMKDTNQGPDFIQIDGAEGGTGSAPPHYADHMARPLEEAFSQVYKAYFVSGSEKQVVWMASGRLSSPAMAIKMMAMGADAILIARPAMMAMGCLQTQNCHKSCPVGIQTQNKWLQLGLDSKYAAQRVERYIRTFRADISDMTRSAGYNHPSEFTMKDVEKNSWAHDLRKSLYQIYGYQKLPATVNMNELYEKQLVSLSTKKQPNLLLFGLKESKWNFIKNDVLKASKPWKKIRK